MDTVNQTNLGDLRPYRYQEEVFRRAQKGNIIAALNTGSGKTLISVLLIKWMTAQARLKNKVVIFLVPRVTLVEQQATYIKDKTGLKVSRLHGSLTDLDLSNRSGWRKRFESHAVFVMTPQIFLNLITHSIWSFEKVSLMVFDECHHTRKNHPYNSILREYHHVPPLKRPKIFGMTASPIWDIKNPQMSLATLEANMDAKVIGVQDHVEELYKNTPKPNEIIKQYAFPPENYDFFSPTIFECLKMIDHNLWDALDLPWKSLEIRYYSTLNGLGPYAASLFLTIEVSSQLEKYLTEHKPYKSTSSDDSKLILPTSSQQALPNDIHLLIDILEDFAPFFPLSLDSSCVSIPVKLEWCTPKVKTLAEMLLEYYTPTFQAIIFVEQRQNASVLAKVLPAIPELKGYIKCAHLVGQGVSAEGLTKQSDRQYGDPIAMFRKKEINILIATSVAEEGLDFPACDLVVRFDPFQHMVGYVQSRGRARNKASRFVVMIQDDDVVQLTRYQSFKENETAINLVYQKRHPERVDEGKEDIDDDDDTDARDMVLRERYVIPTTGAVLTYDNALNILIHLCSLIPRDHFTLPLLPKYDGDFQTILELPSALPLSRVHLRYHGPLRCSKKEAKRAVTFLAVKNLIKLGVVNEYLLPVEKEHDEGGDDPMSSLSARHGRQKVPVTMTVPVRDPWCIGERLWIHPVVIEGLPAMGLVTSTQLPPIQLLYQGRHVQLHPGQWLTFQEDLEHEQRAALREFTQLGIFYSITARLLKSPPSLYFVPITTALRPDFTIIDRLISHPQGNEDWTQVTEADYDKVLVRCTYMPGGVFSLNRVFWDLSPMSTPRAGSFESTAPTYYQFWSEAWANRLRGRTLPTEGPLLDASRLVRNKTALYNINAFLQASVEVPSSTATKDRKTMLPRDGCKWLAFPFHVRQAFEILPSLCHRVTDIYRVRCMSLELGISSLSTDMLIQCMTLPSAAFPFNNQRLETLGDAVLQVCNTVYLFNQYPHRHEGQLTALRKKHVQNSTLCGAALRLGLSRFIISETPSVHTWPHIESSLHTPGNPVHPSVRRVIEREYPRRSLQDCMEALLGASFLAGGIPSALQNGTALEMEMGGSVPWHMRYPTTEVETPLSPLFENLEQTLGYKFRRNTLVLEALTHPSFVSDRPSYQRLEFLGDAILDLAVVHYLYLKFPDATSHQLSHPRSKAICAQSLAYVAVRKLGLHQLMLYNSMELNNAIERSVRSLKHVHAAEIVNQGWKFDPPKALSDVFESIIGAVLVDSGYNYEKTAEVVEYVMEDILSELSPAIAKDPVSELTEYVSGAGCRLQVKFERMVISHKNDSWEKEAVGCRLHGVVLVDYVVSSSLNISKFAAAHKALTILKDETSGMSLKQTCDCQVKIVTGEEESSMTMDTPLPMSIDDIVTILEGEGEISSSEEDEAQEVDSLLTQMEE